MYNRVKVRWTLQCRHPRNMLKLHVVPCQPASPGESSWLGSSISLQEKSHQFRSKDVLLRLTQIHIPLVQLGYHDCTCWCAWSTSYTIPSTPDTLSHSSVIKKKKTQTVQERKACKYVPMLTKLLFICKKSVHRKGKWLYECFK